METKQKPLSIKTAISCIQCMAPRLCTDFTVIYALCLKIKPALEIWNDVMSDAWWRDAADLYCKLERRRQEVMRSRGYRELTDEELVEAAIRDERIEKESEHVED